MVHSGASGPTKTHPLIGLPDNLKFFQGHFVFQIDTMGYFHPFSKLSRMSKSG